MGGGMRPVAASADATHRVATVLQVIAVMCNQLLRHLLLNPHFLQGGEIYSKYIALQVKISRHLITRQTGPG
jgi:hypothetical protein